MTDSDRTATARKSWWSRTVKPGASGIFQKRTMYLRQLAGLSGRPPKALSPADLLEPRLLLFGVALGGRGDGPPPASRRAVRGARRAEPDGALRDPAHPPGPRRLSRSTRRRSQKELAARLAAADAQKSSEFYLVLDTQGEEAEPAPGRRRRARGAARDARAAPDRGGVGGEACRRRRCRAPSRSGEKLERPAWKPPAWAWKEAGLPVPIAAPGRSAEVSAATSSC